MAEVEGVKVRDDREPRPWSNQIFLIVLTGLVGAAFGLAGTFGGRFVNASDSTMVLVSKVDDIREQNKAQDAKLTAAEQTSREILMKLSGLYTREEAARDREAAERRFQRVEQQMSDGMRRIDALEVTVRSLQQAFIDRSTKR